LLHLLTAAIGTKRTVSSSGRALSLDSGGADRPIWRLAAEFQQQAKTPRVAPVTADITASSFETNNGLI